MPFYTGALVRATDDGTSKSLDGLDPDGNQFEVAWMVPRSYWEPDAETTSFSLPLDIEHEVARYGASGVR